MKVTFPAIELCRCAGMPLKKVAISHWLGDSVLYASVPLEDVEVIPIAIDHDRFRVTNSIQKRPM